VKADVAFGQISHGLALMAEMRDKRIFIVLDPNAQTAKLVLNLYDMDFAAFGSMAKDFVRTMIFPRVADFVPSSTKEGAEAFLKAIRRPRDTFEYEETDLGNLPEIWEDYEAGNISLEQAVRQSRSAVRSNVHYVDSSAAAAARDVVPDVIENEAALQGDPAAPDPMAQLEPLPPILRSDVSSPAKLLTIDISETPLRGYRNFIAISDRVREEMGEFFLQPHRTSIIWGGAGDAIYLLASLWTIWIVLRSANARDGGRTRRRRLLSVSYHCAEGPYLYSRSGGDSQELRS
ncbi:MAG TPA: hypothetical protein VIJ94_01115, partial [Caulobacteraceae bacterium]